MWDERERVALVEDRLHNGYILRVGSRVGKGNGRVVRILPERVEILSREPDLYGNMKEKRYNLELYPKVTLPVKTREGGRK